MNLKSIDKDIKDLEKALKIIENTENYLHFPKGHVIKEVCESINILRDKRDTQINALRTLAQ